MPYKQKSGNLHSSKYRHTKQNYFARMGRRGGLMTKRRHQSKGLYSKNGKKGGEVTRKKFAGKKRTSGQAKP